MIHTNQRKNPSTSCLNYEQLWIKWKGNHICERYITKSQITHQTVRIKIGKFQHSILSNGQLIHRETKHKNNGANRHYKQNGLNRYL